MYRYMQDLFAENWLPDSTPANFFLRNREFRGSKYLQALAIDDRGSTEPKSRMSCCQCKALHAASQLSAVYASRTSAFSAVSY